MSFLLIFQMQISPLSPPVIIYFPLGQIFIILASSCIVFTSLVFFSFTKSIIFTVLSTKILLIISNLPAYKTMKNGELGVIPSYKGNELSSILLTI